MKFKIGDVVKLKSGGPRMTIADCTNEEYPLYTCMWFDITKNIQEMTFEEFILKKVKKIIKRVKNYPLMR